MSGFSPAELTRYSRHVQLAEVGLEGQRRLKSSRVLIVGAGGLGSPAALYLAAAGVGTLGIVDFDRVEAHNLHRQLLHSDADIGNLKTASAAGRLRTTNPHVSVEEHPFAVTPDNAVELFERYDVIVDGTDTFPTRYLNNDAAVLAKRPLVYGSIFKFEGSVSVFAPHRRGPCYRCLFPTPPPVGSVPSCGEAGVLGALCGVIGSLQALETIKLLIGLGEPLLGRLLTYDALSQTMRTIGLPKDPNCPVCGSPSSNRTKLRTADYAFDCQTSPPANALPMSQPAHDSPPLETTVEETHRLLATSPDRVRLIDVREPYEREICQIVGAETIPMRQIPENLTTLPKDKHLLIHCHHGGRSLRVTEYLRAHGFPNVSNVAGGIDAWSERIDPTVRRY